jgi:hypothetical protein
MVVLHRVDHLAAARDEGAVGAEAVYGGQISGTERSRTGPLG